MKHHWYINLTPEQVKRLTEGLLSRFRFQLRIAATTTVQYDVEKHNLSVYIVKGVKPDNIHKSISHYINGFVRAIEA